MLEEFDPYSQWLGILGQDRPVDHYCLLGITRFTQDRVAIELAADRRMALLRSYQNGPRGRLTQQLLNEVAAAKLCLINTAARAAYDAMLEGLALATEPPPLASSSAQRIPPAVPQSNAPEQRELLAVIVVETESDDVAEVKIAKRSGGVPFSLAVLVVSVVVIVFVGSYVIQQVIADRSQTSGPWVNVEDPSQQTGTDDADEEWSIPIAEPVVIYQEADGSVNFTPSVAALNGDSVRLETAGITDFLTGWTSTDDSAVWKCKIIKLPPNGIFRVFVTYRAATDAEAGSYTIAINGREKSCDVRGTGEFVTDTLYLAVTQSGEQSMELRLPKLPGGEFMLKGIRLEMPTEQEE
jgi:hypothetical protein